MTDDLQTRITELQNRLATAQRTRARAEAAHDAAKAQHAKFTEQLLREYGIGSIEQARAWLTTARAELDALLDQLDRQLTDAGSPS